jgi:glycosyltransferase involved in cell wall biosynthesis
VTENGILQEFKGKRIAFVTTRIAGQDGVSLEIEKWACVLERLGIECFYIAGECDRPDARTALIEEAHFQNPEIIDITREAFEAGPRSRRLGDSILDIARFLRDRLTEAMDGFGVNAIIAQNALTIPMNIPLGIAIVQAVQERSIGCIAHHHDFYWERDRFSINAVEDFLRYAFPPSLPSIQHIVINSIAAAEFSRRTGLPCRTIPNVMDFASPPEPDDGYSANLRRDLDMGDDDLLILQPTRVVARKGIEHSVELVRRLKSPGARLMISHAAGDEGDSYANFLNLFSDLMRVQLVFGDPWVSEQRGLTTQGQRVYTLSDVYRQADFVAYPSEYEGFGNAFLEATYYHRPILCKRYPIFCADIEPCGFQTIMFDDFVTAKTVQAVEQLLADDEARKAMVEHNYRIARQYFSYEVLEEELRPILRTALKPAPSGGIKGAGRRLRSRSASTPIT